MNLTCDSKDLDDYLFELAEVDYSNPIIRAKSNLLAAVALTRKTHRFLLSAFNVV